MADFKGLQDARADAADQQDAGARSAQRRSRCRCPRSPSALSKGVVDGYLLPWEVIPSIKAHELTKYESETDPKSRALYTAVFILAMNQAKYDSLPARPEEGDRREFRARAVGGVRHAMGCLARRRRASYAVDRGNTFYIIPASELAHWQKATAHLDDEWVKDVTAKGARRQDAPAVGARPHQEVRRREVGCR